MSKQQLTERYYTLLSVLTRKDITIDGYIKAYRELNSITIALEAETRIEKEDWKKDHPSMQELQINIC
jgi:hypothetical protein